MRCVRAKRRSSNWSSCAPFGIYIVDSQFCIAHMNAGAQNGAFRNVRPVIGRPFNEAMHILWPDVVAEGIIGNFRHTLETGEPYYSPPFFNPRLDAEIVEGYEWELHRMTFADGQYGVICYYFDSTKLRQAQEDLRQSEERFRQLADAMPQLVWTANSDGITDYYNSRSVEYGVSATALTSDDWTPALHPEDVAPTMEAWREAVARGLMYQNEQRLRAR